MGAVTPLRSAGAAERRREEEAMEGGAGGGEDGRMDYVPWVLNGMINERRLQRVLSLLWTSRDTTGSPLVTHTNTHTLLQCAHRCWHTLQTHCKAHTHTSHTPVTADIIINNGGTMGSGATIANTTQRLEVFTVHELDVTRLSAAAAAAHFLRAAPPCTLTFQIHDWLVWRLD